jgi:hypothetical protein
MIMAACRHFDIFQVDASILITANVPSAKKVVVHGPQVRERRRLEVSRKEMYYENARNENRRNRRMRPMKIGVVGEGAE